MVSKEAQIKGKKHIGMTLAVAARALEYIGHSDCDFIAPGAKALQYNVMAKGHVKYKSTVAYKHGWV
jgi:hypothetical protein